MTFFWFLANQAIDLHMLRSKPVPAEGSSRSAVDARTNLEQEISWALFHPRIVASRAQSSTPRGTRMI